MQHKHFLARSYKTKHKYRDEDARLCAAISEKMKSLGFPNDTADLIVQWNPYDQNASAPFFDSEHMFGLTDGFDVVIGNPPYVQIQKLTAVVKAVLESQQYKTYTRTGDIYQLFYESGMTMLKDGGRLCYITSNKWMRTDYGEVTRDYFATKCRAKIVIDFGMAQMFESATTYTNILLLQKAKPEKRITMCRVNDDYFRNMPLALYVLVNGIEMDNPGAGSWIAYDRKTYSLVRKIERQGMPLKDWSIQINYGIKTGFNKAFIIDTPTRDQLVAEDPKSAEIIHKILRGEDVKAFLPEWAGKWIIGTFPALSINIDKYPAIKKHLTGYRKLIEPKPKGHSGQWEGRKTGSYEWFETQDSISYHEDFLQPKIIYPNMTKYLPFVYDRDQFFYTNQKCFIITGTSLSYLTCFFNSPIFRFAFKERFPELLGDTRELSKVFFEEIPIKPINAADEKVFKQLLEKVVKLRANGKSSEALELKILEMLADVYGLSKSELSAIADSECTTVPRINERSALLNE